MMEVKDEWPDWIYIISLSQIFTLQLRGANKHLNASHINPRDGWATTVEQHVRFHLHIREQVRMILFFFLP